MLCMPMCFLSYSLCARRSACGGRTSAIGTHAVKILFVPHDIYDLSNENICYYVTFGVHKSIYNNTHIQQIVSMASTSKRREHSSLRSNHILLNTREWTISESAHIALLLLDNYFQICFNECVAPSALDTGCVWKLRYRKLYSYMILCGRVQHRPQRADIIAHNIAQS